ncbi:helix-turn-helix transcriptional regulator [Streptomyces sp. NBC_01016]|uniref:helix-turn-helix domain-containing protein n=1 Tax=Streptomyces sp. NBC_01016 TaxID=2903720 RepID=UPI002254F2A4|nr:helix-turn-helix transcriptional regulator [Streptomyces sp. NBC_01016]MCX4827126.1 helix-turn-helix transcriptional regulator [Streptomyces sp. NBC_01016]MCX4832385.1 helix-turn-helix transcriptional regulator [Streptomyces sp. NBC_01016]
MAPEPRYELVRPDLLRLLMERTWTGADVSGRELAAAIGVPRATVNALLTGTTRSAPETVARAICREIGIELLCLWAPKSRTIRTPEPAPQQLAVA